MLLRLKRCLAPLNQRSVAVGITLVLLPSLLKSRLHRLLFQFLVRFAPQVVLGHGFVVDYGRGNHGWQGC